MRLRYGVAFLAVVLVLVVFSLPALSAPMEATISLGRDPEPPMCVLNPGGVIDISWNIEHTTTPLNDTYCKQTGPDGRVCWNDLPYGDYTVYEVVLPGWDPVGPPS